LGLRPPAVADDDLLAEIAVLRHRSHEGQGDIARLVRLAGHPQRAMADAAREALAALQPMAALLERWAPEAGESRSREWSEALPPWLLESCSDWGAESRLVRACVDELVSAEGEARRRLLGQLAGLPGLTRLLGEALADRDPALAESFADACRIAHAQRFPLQINLAPTLACQLSCAYCYSAGVEAEADTPRLFEDLLAVLDWAKEQGVRRVGLTGGEPTLYPRFAELVRAIEERGLEMYIASNGLMSEEALAALAAARPLAAALHLTDDVRGDARWRVFQRSARTLIEAGVHTALRVNLSRPSHDVEALAVDAARLGVREIRVAVPVPNACRTNAFVGSGSLTEYGQLIDRLVAAARRKGVPVVLCKPFPVCALPERSARLLLAGGSLAVNCPVHLSDFTNNIVIWPNRTYSPCLGVNTVIERAVTDSPSLGHAAGAYRPLIDRLTRVPLLETCRKCPLWSGARCLGGCLSYRLSEDVAQ